MQVDPVLIAVFTVCVATLLWFLLSGSSKQSSTPKTNQNQPATSSSSSNDASNNDQSANVTYFKSAEEVTEGNSVKVTDDLQLLQKCWDDAEMGANDDLPAYLGQIAQVVEIEEDDDTLQIQWGNFDTCWIPALACSDAGKQKATIPGVDNSWLPDKPANNGANNAGGEDEELPPDGKLFSSVEDVPMGETVRVTRDPELLAAKWKAAELGPHDNLASYCGCIGRALEEEEDDDTIQVEWLNMDTCWMPAAALYNANGAKPTIPKDGVSWTNDP